MSEKDVTRDGYGRRINYLRLSVTDRCNLRCRYCMPEGGVPMLRHQDILSFEELREVVDAAASLGVTKVRLTGGEPLVRRGIVDLVRMLAGVPGVREVAMTTNGTLLSPLAADLRAAGLSRVNLSLDTLDPARYARITRGGRLEDALAGLHAALDAGFSGDKGGAGEGGAGKGGAGKFTPGEGTPGVKVNCVLVGGFNDDEVARVAGLARDLPIDVRFIELMPLGPSANWPQARFVPAERVLEAVPDAVPVGASAAIPLSGATVPDRDIPDAYGGLSGATVPDRETPDAYGGLSGATVPERDDPDAYRGLSGATVPDRETPDAYGGLSGMEVPDRETPDAYRGLSVPDVPRAVPPPDPGVAELYQVPGWAGRIGLIRPMGHRFCSQCNRIRVTSDGMLKPCLHSAAEIPLRGLHGEALVDAIRRGIEAKPEGHHMDASDSSREGSQSARGMNEIGG